MEGRPLEVPGLYLGGDRDIVTMWSGTAIKRFGEHCPHARPPVIIAGAGDWIQQEKPAETNAALLEFLGGV